MRCNARALFRDWFFGNLHEDLLTFVEQIRYRWLLLPISSAATAPRTAFILTSFTRRRLCRYGLSNGLCFRCFHRFLFRKLAALGLLFNIVICSRSLFRSWAAAAATPPAGRKLTARATASHASFRVLKSFFSARGQLRRFFVWSIFCHRFPWSSFLARRAWLGSARRRTLLRGPLALGDTDYLFYHPLCEAMLLGFHFLLDFFLRLKYRHGGNQLFIVADTLERTAVQGVFRCAVNKAGDVGLHRCRSSHRDVRRV